MRAPLLMVVLVEATGVYQFIEDKADLKQIGAVWDPQPYMGDETGRRIFEEVARRARKALAEIGDPAVRISISMPGMITGHDTVQRSTRLGVLLPIKLSSLFAELDLPDTLVLHDTECLALGEALSASFREHPNMTLGHEEFAFIYVSEGVGATIMIDGRAHPGAGCAGRLGRLIVAPEGSYHPTFAARGPLEHYATRPSISAGIVERLQSIKGKAGDRNELEEWRRFRAEVGAAANSGWHGLSLYHIANGLAVGDPIAKEAVSEAAHYLGLAIQAIITIIHPPSILLGGSVIVELPSFSDQVIEAARSYSYDLAWNQTSVYIVDGGRETQANGACELTRRIIDNR